ncbi:hypothetical protein C5C27_06200 [Rathayibacter sp. AY2B7]|uniref:TY-Chap2 family putative peptide chaperone n=1 Tax=Rathayibacter sp. AY2B7 TaxID=2080571 RepID=UPI000CE85885|nr:hypothetical protein [Rathayibacter sp. AY2B7]PPG63107.1 hypothetical protein C5C27_06200 [Rathayibacter sp. AY2B7]
MNDFEPADRFVVDQAWWLASELCRRNSRLVTFYEVFEDGHYRGPSVIDALRPQGRVFFNQMGRIWFHGLEDAPEPIPFAEGIAEENSHALVKRIEKVLGWSKPTADSTTPRSLTYRILSAVMTQVLHHRDHWNVIDGAPIEHGYGPPKVPDHFTDFSGADAARLSARPPRFWAIQRSNQTVALIDDRATLYRRAVPPQDLMIVYKRRRKLRDAVAYVLEEID